MLCIDYGCESRCVFQEASLMTSNLQLDVLQLPLSPQQSLVAAGAGAVTFPLVLGLTQVGIFKPLRLSTGLPLLIAATVGGVSVTTASLAASCAVVKTYSLSRAWIPESETHSGSHTISYTLTDLLVSSTASIVLYRALGGRFVSALPSHLLKPGAYAVQWIPAHSTNYANGIQRKFIQNLGARNGCHSCGTRFKVSQFVADHQPPNKLVRVANENTIVKENSVLQKFYPQCQKCSSQQAASLRGNDKHLSLVAHPFSLRLYHLFLPLPLALVYFKSYLSEPTVEVTSVVPVAPPSAEILSESIPPQVQLDQSSSNQQRLSDLIINFPLLIIWKKVVLFLESFPSVDRFHLTLWFFSIIAALGTL